MKPSSTKDVTDILIKVRNGEVERRDIKLLFLELRDLTDSNSSLRDIASSIHPERDRGNSFRMISKHVDSMVDVAINSGTLVIEGIYKESDVIDELERILHEQGFDQYLGAVRRETKSIIKAISEFLDGTVINVKNAYVSNCHLEILDTGDDVSVLCFVFNFNQNINGALNVNTNISVAMPFFV